MICINCGEKIETESPIIDVCGKCYRERKCEVDGCLKNATHRVRGIFRMCKTHHDQAITTGTMPNEQALPRAEGKV